MRGLIGTGRILWLTLLAASAFPHFLSAQSIFLNLDKIALNDALTHVADRAHVEVVYAHRLTEGHMVSCQYSGSSPAEALTCVLAGTGLTVEAVQKRQFVVLRKVETEESKLGPKRRSAGQARLSGQVTDAETGHVLPGAHVFLQDIQRGTTSDAEGRFMLSGLDPGDHRLRVSFVGYESVDLQLTTREFNPVALTPAAVQGGEVVIESDRSVDPEAEPVPGSVAVLTHRAARSPSFLVGDDLFRTLQRLPGVRQSGELGGQLIVRGSGPNENLYMLDGAPLYHPWHAVGLFSTLQTEVLRNAQLYQGTMPPEFGGRLSSVLDMQLKDGSGVDPYAQVGLGSQSVQFMAEVPLSPKVSFMIGGRKTYTNSLLGERGVEVRQQAGLLNSTYYDLNAKLTARPWRGHEFRFTTYHAGDRLPLGGEVLGREDLGWNRYTQSVDPLSADRYAWNSHLFSLQHAYLYSPRLFLTTTAYYSGYKSQDRPDEVADPQREYTMRVADVGLKFDATSFYRPRHTLRMGAHLTYHRFRNLHGLGNADAAILHDILQNSAGVRLNALEGAFYVQDTWQVTSRWQIQPGLRVGYFSSNVDVHAMPRLSSQFIVHPERLILKAGLSRQVQYIHQVQDRYAAAYGLAASRWVSVAAEQVEPATGFQAALGAESRPHRDLRLSADVYWRTFSHVLIPQSAYNASDEAAQVLDEASVLQRYESGANTAFGLEMLAQFDRGAWHFWASYAGGRSLARSYETSAPEHPTEYDVPHTLRGGLNWTRGSWALSLDGEIRNGYPVAPSNLSYEDPREVEFVWSSDAPTPILTNELHRLPTYARIDAQVGYRFKLLDADWRMQLYLYNLTNRHNVIGHIYDLDVPWAAAQDLVGIERLPLFKMQVSF